MESDSPNRPTLTYLDFELEIEKESGRRYLVKVIESPAGQAQEVMHFPFNDAAFDCIFPRKNKKFRVSGRLSLTRFLQVRCAVVMP